MQFLDQRLSFISGEPANVTRREVGDMDDRPVVSSVLYGRKDAKEGAHSVCERAAVSELLFWRLLTQAGCVVILVEDDIQLNLSHKPTTRRSEDLGGNSQVILCAARFCSRRRVGG